MGDVRFTGTADYSQAVKAVDTLLKQNDKLKQKFKEMVAASKKGTDDNRKGMAALAKEFDKVGVKATKLKGQINQQASATLKAASAEKELARAAAKVKAETITPTEKYNAKLKQLRVLLGRSKISQEQYNRAVRRAKGDLDQASAAGKRAFGAGAVRTLASYASGVVGIGAAVAVVATAFRDVIAAREELTASLRQSEKGLAPLAQLAGGDVGKLKNLISEARELFRGGGAETLEEAGTIVFQLESAGALKQREFFADLFAIADTARVAESAGRITKALGAEETGTFRQLASKGLAAAGPVPGVNVADILEAATKPAAPAKLLGLSDEEVLAAISLTAGQLGAAEAGTSLNRLLAEFVKKGFADREQPLSIAEMVREVSESGLNQAELIEFFGRETAFKAFSAVTPETLTARQTEIEAAQETDLAGRVIASTREIPRIEVARLDRIAKAGAELAGEEVAIVGVLADAALADRVEQNRLKQDSFLPTELNISLEKIQAAGIRFVEGDKALLERLTGTIDDPEIQAQVDRVLGPRPKRQSPIDDVFHIIPPRQEVQPTAPGNPLSPPALRVPALGDQSSLGTSNREVVDAIERQTEQLSALMEPTRDASQQTADTLRRQPRVLVG